MKINDKVRKKIIIFTLRLCFTIITSILVLCISVMLKNFIIKSEEHSFWGYSTYIVNSSNIRPETDQTDVILVKKVDNGEFKVGDTDGDIVVFKSNNAAIAAILFTSYKYEGKTYYKPCTYDKKYYYSAITDDQIIGKGVIIMKDFGSVILFLQMYKKYAYIIFALQIFTIMLLSYQKNKNILRRK